MSEGVTHTAVVDDCARLVAVSRDVPDAFREALDGRIEIARLGGITRHGDLHNPGLLERIRDRWPGGPGDGLHERLAFVIGWLSHRAADRQMKRVFREADLGLHALSPTDCSVYHDAFVMREVYAGADPFPPRLVEPGTASNAAASAAAKAIDVEEVEGLFRAMWQRMLLAMHTFIPDDEDAEGWLGRVLATVQRVRVDLRRYAEALARPDPDKVRRYVEEVRFYDREEPLLRLLASLRRDGGAPDAGAGPTLEAALEAARGGSLYARAVARAFGYVRAAGEFFERRIGREELARRLEIGRPELSG